MKTRLISSAVGFAVAAAAIVSLASPAQASGYVKQGSYNWNDQCLSVGAGGVAGHTWTAYYCQTVTPSGPTGPGLYTLWVEY